MASTNTARSAEISPAEPLETKLEVFAIPVSDAERSKRFYERLGWRLDADFTAGDEWRVVQVTPPGSPCSILFGKGFTAAVPGSVQGLFLIVADVAAARAELIAKGVEVSELFHFAGPLRVTGTRGRVAGPHPDGQSYGSYASFNDPDGNGWLLQEIKTRLPGRGFSMDVPTLTEVLREAEDQHGKYEPTAPKHHWSAWYAAYVIARQRGKTVDEAAQAGKRQVEGE